MNISLYGEKHTTVKCNKLSIIMIMTAQCSSTAAFAGVCTLLFRLHLLFVS